MYLPKGGGSQAKKNIHALWTNVWAVITYFYTHKVDVDIMRQLTELLLISVMFYTVPSKGLKHFS